MEDLEVKTGADAQNEDKNKDHKKFIAVVDQIMTLLSDDKSVLKTKVPNDSVGGLMSKMTEKRREAAAEKFMGDMDALVDRYITFQRESSKRRKEFENAEIAKEKEFTAAANAVLGQVEDINAYYGQYKKALNVVAGQKPTIE